MQIDKMEVDDVVDASIRVDSREEAVDLLVERAILLVIGMYAVAACLIALSFS